MKRIICAVTMLALCGCAAPSGDVLAYRANMEKRTFVALSEEAVKASIGYVEEAIEDDSVVSPIGFSLCLGAVGVNSAYPEVALSRLGLTEDGYKPLLDCLNYQDDESALRSTAFAQLIHSDGSLHYVEGRRQQMMEEYGISSIESSVDSYENDALDLMEICLGKTIPLPSLEGVDFSTDLALMYSALSLKDSVLKMNSEQLSFHSVDGETLSLEGYAGKRTGEIYLETDSYKALKLVLDNTSLCLFLPDEVFELSRRTGMMPADVSVRDFKARWGCCDADGRIRLNWRLVMLPPALREYVLIHELCHLKEMNHSAAFWKLVGKHCGDYRQRRRLLKKYSFLTRMYR